MKNSLLSFLILCSLLLGCSSNEVIIPIVTTEPDELKLIEIEKTKRLALLKGTWVIFGNYVGTEIIQSTCMGCGNPKENVYNLYANFKLTMDEYTYTISGVHTDEQVIWPDSGEWRFGEIPDGETQLTNYLVRSDGLILEYGVNSEKWLITLPYKPRNVKYKFNLVHED